MQLLKHFNEISLHPKNAKELKGLILQLAVQGKLTAQWRRENPNVESAEKLLERIKEEKTLLIKEKKIKKEKPLLPITKDEIPYEVPEGWVWCRMLDFCYLITDGTHHTPTYIDDGVPFLSVKNLSKGILDFSNTRFVSKQTHQELIKRCHPEFGDVLLTKVGTTGIAKVIDSKKEFSIFVSVALLKIPRKKIYPYYLEYCINSPFIKKQSSDGTEGVGNKNLVLRKIKAFAIPLPPLPEQKAIVKVVEQLFKEVEQLEALTEERIQLKEKFATSALKQLTINNTVKEWEYLKPHFHTFFNEEPNIKKLRETILQLAVQGKLTAHWRTSNPIVEPAEQLLERIKEEKERLVKEKKIKKEKPLPPITEDEIPYKLPEGWVWCRLGEIMTHTDAGKSPNCDKRPVQNEEWGVLTTTSIQLNKFNEKANKVLPHNFTINTQYIVKNENVLITRAGPINRTGIACKVASLSENLILSDKTVRLNYVKKYVNPDFIVLTLNSSIIRDLLLGKMIGMASSQVNISQVNVKKTTFPFPPFKEQKAIVEKVNSLMALCDSLEQEVKQSKVEVEMLMKGVLREVVGNNMDKKII